ncbi:MAG: sulfotransferase domain-containing protein [Alphaproteobacteria bacterium]|jgi:hypothetical protein|nr:sulfotransferase domain-containing protein [Rhodospirillaceae bacterium]MBT6510153.1 sulfotransferase domain-containing protein [Rhodospirillaceae bacterium]MBT7614435.1 sulfotransferase domain-containing protein [Rhodospirillaceae bacterium]MBT7648345.1 sulfotransferase domain-containing protein [Rhodospirillaceae bacterium]MDG2481622.1 sulfotransferase domain-containing protein [Alphaproteobacteria bacterium]
MGNLVWLASYPKSGNTWLRAFLTNLMTNAERPVTLDELGRLTAGDAEPSRYVALAGKPIEALDSATVAALRPRVQAQLAAESAETRFVKTHSALMGAHGVPSINLQITAGAIYVVRDPRDVAVSFGHHLGRPLDDIIELMGRDNAVTDSTPAAVSELIGSWSQHVASWTAQTNPALHVVRYEDMLARPQKAFGGIAGFLGLKPPRGRIERAIRHASFKVLRGQEDKNGFRERSEHSDSFFRAGVAGQWRDVMTPEQIRRIGQQHHEQMARFEYLDGRS